MPITAVVLVLLSAGMHVGWNAVVKTSGDPLRVTARSVWLGTASRRPGRARCVGRRRASPPRPGGLAPRGPLERGRGALLGRTCAGLPAGRPLVGLPARARFRRPPGRPGRDRDPPGAARPARAGRRGAPPGRHACRRQRDRPTRRARRRARHGRPDRHATRSSTGSARGPAPPGCTATLLFVGGSILLVPGHALGAPPDPRRRSRPGERRRSRLARAAHGRRADGHRLRPRHHRPLDRAPRGRRTVARDRHGPRGRLGGPRSPRA